MHDLFLALWINAGFAAMFVWFPAKIFAGNWQARGTTVTAFCRFARMVALTVVGVLALASLHVLNAFTLLFFYASVALTAHLYRHHWALQPAVGAPIRRLALAAADLIESRSLRRLAYGGLWKGMRGAAAHWVAELELPEVSASTALMMLAPTVAIALTILLRFTEP